MRRLQLFRLAFATVSLIACMAATSAMAAPERATATFEPLQASGISGDARLQSMQDGGTVIHAQLKGLEPGVEYISFLYQNTTCSTAEAGVELVRFTANPAGNANFNIKVVQDLSAIGSVSIQIPTGQTVLACGSVVPQQ